VVRRIASADELTRVLDEVFDIAPPVSAAERFDRIAKGLDAALMPANR
jgi:hypothetical protein